MNFFYTESDWFYFSGETRLIHLDYMYIMQTDTVEESRFLLQNYLKSKETESENYRASLWK